MRSIRILTWFALLGMAAIILFQIVSLRLETLAIRAVYLADLASKALPVCQSAAAKKKIELNPFSVIDPDSIRPSIETMGLNVQTMTWEKPSRLEFVYNFSKDPDSFAPRSVLLIDLTDVVCAYTPLSGTAEIIRKKPN